MKLLLELMNAPAQLNSTQKGILATIAGSASPEMAFETTSGAEPLNAQRVILQRLGLVVIGGNTVTLTPNGQQALTDSNIVSETGEMTEEGERLMDMVASLRQQARAVD